MVASISESNLSSTHGLTAGRNRLFIPVGDSYSQYIWVIDKDEKGAVTREKSFGVRYVPLTDEPSQEHA